MLVLAHTGCRASEVASTLGIAGAAGVLLLRPWRRRLSAWLLPFVLAVVVTGSACSSGGDEAGEPRPSTPVRLVIETPAPNQVTGPDVAVKLRIVGGRVVERVTGELTPTEGHIHLIVDEDTVTMNYTDQHELRGLSPGTHTVAAEFVAVDHKPFRNRPRATVLFTVQ